MTVCIIVLVMFIVFFICTDIIITSNVRIVDIDYRGVIFNVYMIID